jgi:large subunit ribosomal protein L15
VRLSELNKLGDSKIDIHALKLANLVPAQARSVKVIDSGDLSVAVTLVGIKTTKGARVKIEAAGGTIEA